MAQTMSHWPSWPEPFGLGLEVTPAEACPYLPERRMRVRGFVCHDVPTDSYQDLLDAGFRRSGQLYYQPACADCRECVPLRVPVTGFVANRSQRRCRRCNRDLQAEIGPPSMSDEKHALYASYVAARHRGAQGTDRRSFEEFLYSSSTETIEIAHRTVDGRLLAVSICDLTPTAVSAVYAYYDPAPRWRARGLGTYASLFNIEFARSTRRAHYYMGYWIAGCAAMSYKTRFRPAEGLGTDGVWRTLPRSEDWPQPASESSPGEVVEPGQRPSLPAVARVP